MKAIILAAGESTRMWPLAIRKNKCMYEFLGKPLLQYTLEGLRKFGIRDIIIVRSASDDSIAKALGNGKSLGVNITYVEQPRPLGTGDALLRAVAAASGARSTEELALTPDEALRGSPDLDAALRQFRDAAWTWRR